MEMYHMVVGTLESSFASKGKRWNVCIYEDKEQAQAHLDRAQYEAYKIWYPVRARGNIHTSSNDKIEEDVYKGKNNFDPDMEISKNYCAQYEIEEVRKCADIQHFKLSAGGVK